MTPPPYPLRPVPALCLPPPPLTHALSLCYSAGDLDAARSYYSMSLQLKPKGNLRAAWGLALATSQPAQAHTGKAAADDAGMDALNGIAISKLKQEYAAANNALVLKVVCDWAGQ